MGTWDVGPFDNDGAADFCGTVQDADPSSRPQLIRAALAAAADEDDYLDVDIAQEAIAAAALVASQRPGGPPVTSAYAPDFLRDGGRLELTDDLAPLAVRALQRILGEESEWRELWEETDEATSAMTQLAGLRTALTDR